MRSRFLWTACLGLASLSIASLPAQTTPDFDTAAASAKFRPAQAPVVPQSDGLIVCEAEEFRSVQPGWVARNWGENYFAATFANSFLSRKAYLGAPDEVEQPAVAEIIVNVKEAGRYLVLARYEACYRFETQFTVKVEQAGQTKLSRLYGARNNLKVWAFKEKLKTELAWGWGAVENVVWEGTDAYADLQPGPARITLTADKQPGNPAKRNVDCLVLTRDAADVQKRLENENYLPLDGLLTQCDDVYVKLHAIGAATTLTLPPCTEHSPYWVHLRTWKPAMISVTKGAVGDWQEVGHLLDTLNDGQWDLAAAPVEAGMPLHYKVEFGVRNAAGTIESVRTFESREPKLSLAFHADTRYSKRIRESADVLYDLLAYIKAQPVKGKLPERTLIYGYTFSERPGDAKYNAAVKEFKQLYALLDAGAPEVAAKPHPTGYIDIRGNPTDEKVYADLRAKGIADKIAVVSLGDEIGLPAPPANDPAFAPWLQSKGLTANDVVPGAGTDWTKVVFNAAKETAASNPRLFYYSKLYGNHYAIQKQKEVSDFVRARLPQAHVGANYSPHHHYHYLNDVHQWITLFRRNGMSLPWSEDYIWQVPVGTQQMNFINLDQFRCGIKTQPAAKILYYVMPHWGNTPGSWRRQFYGDLAHGAQILDLFEFRPVQAAYTENHADQPEMYAEIRRSFHELGLFEDVVLDGRVRAGTAALWFSETGDIWDDNAHPFACAKRCLYIAIKHQQLPLDFVLDEDALDGSLKNYKILYLADRHVTQAASKALAAWVQGGGVLFATAGAGMFDEFNQPNAVMRELLGVDQTALDLNPGDPLIFAKQDLPFATALDTVKAKLVPGATDEATTPIFGARSRIKATKAEVKGTFADGSPALTAHQPAGWQGRAYYAAFLPGLSYFKPAIPLRPVDRGSSDDSMAHFIPTKFDPTASAVVGLPALQVVKPVECSEPLVESSILEGPKGAVIPLINWTPDPVKGLKVTLRHNLAGKTVTRSSGLPVTESTVDGTRVFTLDLDVADALIVR